MLNQKLQLKLSQKLSPQQIQLMKLIQLTTTELEQKVKNEIEENPALEQGKESLENESNEFESDNDEGDVNVDDYLSDEPEDFNQNYYSNQEENTNFQTKSSLSFHQFLDNQSKNLILKNSEKPICEFLIGSIDESGYLRREIDDIIDDLAFTQNIIATKDEVLSILEKIQDLDPPGVGARSLQECLLIQLKKKNNLKDSVINSINILENEFEIFSKKKFSKLSEKLNLSQEELKGSIEEISRLNPKPGGSITSEFSNNTIIPDFILTIEDGNFIVELNKRNSPELRLSNSYKNILEGYKNDPKKTKSQNQAMQFLKQKLDSAKWFIEAIEQRHQTLFQTVNAIVNFQKQYFLSGEEINLKPMILKDIAEIINMDISTISRVANSKYIETPYGIKLLKSYFSEGMKNKEGEEISTIEIKNMLKEIVDKENKNKPLSDIELSNKLSDKGYKVARRTVSKYREQLDISVARLRKEL
ncbi:MAG: RNA polymerase factor sigma-54 [Cryomorphaceae bacterium]|jgi:RNA polymerase sigma-54 factor|nr:RNA polymerase factor sigma-54 [Cryomorphaceae bacterium]MDG1888961.1 RNA polymerase factor sigma-54 [Flavobacteriaceae bacterium]MBT3503451.1 RNA polymerase factor sigma-54 [Cryomorphaceae bacterium]MBT3689003.1 RNA polymerase factor sigma-54 [Cryomorphaceae bacterium]MBT4222344.1 RNA polymerase factor sigma-54 [Cryomorphaceae bacterium]